MRPAVTLLAALLLTSCGGGEDPRPMPLPPVLPAPPSVLAQAFGTPVADTTLETGKGDKQPLAGPALPAPTVAQAVAAPAPPAPTLAARKAAAAATAASTLNACNGIRPFYWEVGDGHKAQASGSVLGRRWQAVITATTTLPIASASKWVWAAYVLERRGGQPDAGDLRHLTMRSGHDQLSECALGQTVQQCFDSGDNGHWNPAADGKFHYAGGHYQKHAILLGLGAMDAAQLGAELQARLGQDLPFYFAQARPAGGIASSARLYTVFLRKLLRGELALGRQLGRHAVCTSPQLCGPELASYSPAEYLGNLHYGAGHWIEDEAGSGDGAFSSPGAFGFYPWIDASRASYGLVARSAAEGGPGSTACGRLIRRAWSSGTPQ